MNIQTVAETGSTNADMLARAAAGADDGLWLRAERQNAGRGRLGRAWRSPVGNLYASRLVRLRAGDPDAATLGFVAAVALDEVLRGFAPEVAFQIKWPNDVLAAGAKLSGILLERSGDAVVIGMGVNLASHPQDLDRPTTSLAALTGRTVDAGMFLSDLADVFEGELLRWRREGLASILEAWHARAHPIGTPLVANLPDGSNISGVYDGLGPDGALRLRLTNGTSRAIHAGDVFIV